MYPKGAKNPGTGMKHGVVYAVKGSDGQWKKFVDLHTCGNGHDFWMTYDVSDVEKVAYYVNIKHMTIPLGLSISQKLGAEADFLIQLYKMTAEQWCYTTIPSRRFSLWAIEKRGEEIPSVIIGKEEISLLDRVYGGYGNSVWLSMLTTVPREETLQ
ncbi:MAG: hypothetical protein HGA33_00710 [Candidatus Moranbacteria bacterium]|nr:hypothetical protein [Candidatus Moranbacteria bacterium]